MADITENLYNSKVPIDANQYELVLSFFKSVTSNLTAAKAYSQTLFNISAQTGYDIMDLLESLQGQDGIQVSASLAYFLNSFSDKTVMYGITQVIQPDQNVARNILR
jgi:hypothetical protein